MSRDAEVIRLDRKNTVESLTAQLISLTSSGADDSGFPILRNKDDEGFQMVGYIGANELEHALSMFYFVLVLLKSPLTEFAGLVSSDTENEIHFHTTYSHPLASSSISSLQESSQVAAPLDPFDFTPYMDQVRTQFKYSFLRSVALHHR